MKNKILMLTLIISSFYVTAQAQTSLAPPKWHPVVKTALTPDGTLPVSGNRDKEYSIPSSIPGSAKEVLLFVMVRNAGNVNANTPVYFKIYTQNNSQDYAKYLYWDPAGGTHVSYNSDNIWLPITKQRTIKCTRETGNGGTAGIASSISIIGYR